VALADLLDAIEAEAAAQIRATVTTGDADAAQIDADAARARAERSDRETRSFAVEREALADRRLASARRTARAAVLTARAAMLERVRAVTRARLPGALDDAVGRSLLACAMTCTGGVAGVLRCTPALVDAARAAAPTEVRVECDPAIAAGVVIELAGGTRIIATLDALLDREWPRLAAEVSS